MLLDLYGMATVVSGTGNVAVSVFDVSATGAEVFMGSGSELFAVADLTVSGVGTFAGSGGVSFGVAVAASGEAATKGRSGRRSYVKPREKIQAIRGYGGVEVGAPEIEAAGRVYPLAAAYAEDEAIWSQ